MVFPGTLPPDLVHDPCVEDWQAVTMISSSTTSSDCRVTTLNLSGKGLLGSLPSSLGNLDAANVCWLFLSLLFKSTSERAGSMLFSFII